jgi:Gluconate 2-dehydrogenase subunit 3
MTALKFKDDLVTRREALRRVSALFGGVALIGQSAWLTGCATAGRTAEELFAASDVVLLDEIAETILPETKTPGAKAAGVGPFIAMMVAETYDPRRQNLFREGLRTLERESTMQNGAGFLASSPAQRLALLERLDREAIEYMRAPTAGDRPHYFRMLKELTLLGYFTSEIGYTQAQRYVETPGRFEPRTTYAVGDKAWAPHA